MLAAAAVAAALDASDLRMRDGFATLGLPRSLLIAEEEIEEAWRARARDAGGDAGQGPADAEEAHEARRTLRDPVSRLEHWLSLVAPGRSEAARGAAVDAPLMSLFEAVHAALGAADAVIERHRAAASSLAKALLASEALRSQLALQETLRRIQEEVAARVARFAALEEACQGPNPSCDAAREVLGQLKFLRKWERQAQERLVALIGL